MIHSPREFRIGNLVTRPYDTDILCEVNGSMIEEWGRGQDLREYLPMPFNKKVLTDFGFQHTTAGPAYMGLMVPFTPIALMVHKFGSTLFVQLMLHPDIKLSQPLQYVHQLQNIYYSLTQLELKRKTS